MRFDEFQNSDSNFEKIRKTKKKLSDKFSKNKEKELRIEQERKMRRKLKNIAKD